ADWLLWLDADDRMNPEDAAALREHLLNTEKGYLIRVVSGAGGSGAGEFLQLRLFPNIEGLEWEGRVHEQILPSLQGRGLAAEVLPGVAIVHEGYDDPAALRRKSRRNAKLLEKERVLRPDDPYVLQHLAQAYGLLGDIEKAIEVSEALIDAKDIKAPDEFLTHTMNRLAQYCLILNDVERAEMWAERVLEAEPDNRLARYFLGEICYRKGAHGEAVKRFEQFVNAEEVIGCVPVPWRALTANAHNFLGLARERTGQRDKALVEFRRAAELGARVEAHKNLARLYLEDGRPEEAESALRAAVELQSDDAVVWTNLGAALARLGKFGEAAEASRKALEIDPACAAARQNLRRLEDRARSMSRPDKSFTPSACMIAKNEAGHLKDANETAELGAAVETSERSGDSSAARNNMECVRRNTVAPSQEGCDLSLNMIVKDEEENLREGLAAIAHLFDEIVIVDTGSSDRTAEIAEELGARVVHHQWNDSFADARNAALGNSRGTWIFWLDADDRIEPRAVQTLRKFIARGIPCGALFPIESAIADNGSVVQNYTLRLFPNNPGIEWKGAVHEQIAGSLRSAGIELVNCPDFTIRHVGYEDEGESWEKNLRNLKLLAKELAARPEDPYVLFALAQAFLFCGQVEHATKWLRLLWGLRDKANGDAYREVFWMAGVVLSDCAVKSGKMAEADTWLERAIESYPDNWLPYFQLGERKLLYGDFEVAALLLRKAAEIGIGPTLLPLDIEDMRKKLDRYLSELEEAKVNGLLGKTSAKKPMANRKKRKKKKARRRARPDTGRATVSLCMIVKNEEEYLGRCIESARRAVDEIIVVDTGSEDGTAELARRLGAKVYHHPWRNDFAEARNFSIKHASGDWILYLDADEVLTPDACAGIRNLTRKPSAMGYILIQRNYTNDPKAAGWRPCDAGSPEAGGNAGWFPAPIVRLFRNHPAIRFEGAVHELVDHSISRLGGKVELTDIAIHHYGKVRDLDYVKSKQELYLKLGKEKAESRPNDAKAHYELGVQFIELGLLEKGIESLKRSLELETNQPKAHCDLGVALERSGSLQEAADHYARALKVDPENAQAIINLGSAYARLGRMEEASLLFERALAAGPNDPVALNNVGSKLFMQGKFKEAAELYRRAIKANPSYAQAYFNLGTAFEKQGDLAAARSALGRAAELDPMHHESLANLSVVLMRLGLWEEAEKRCRKALEIKPDDHVSHNNMGAICHQLGQAECGAEHILTSHEIDPDYEPARENLAQFEKQCPQLLASLRARRSAKPARSRGRKRVIFYHRGMDFDGSTVSARPLGGSESALVYMARELARLGCEVLVFNSCLKPKDCDGVRYLPLSGFAGFAAGQTTDIFVAQRYWQPFLTNLQAGAKIYWVQDAHDQPFVQGLRDPQTSARIDRIFTISEWQTRMFQSEFGLPRSKFFVTRNGFCSDLFAENGATRRPYRLAYTST
ncbi:MAG: tetratricopeptide repeat protein, partial [Candidatus Abyssubacteria bacterium]|nr:tetratricopeptide repeat protein [Candidatus Abyssubacteria bacterium]